MPRRRRQKKKYEWINPEFAMYLGYELHVTDDPFTADLLRKATARRDTSKILDLEPNLDNPDGQYLAQVRSVMISYAGAMARLKKNLIEESSATSEENKELQKRIVSSRMMSSMGAAFLNLGMGSLLFGIGFFLAHTIAGFIPSFIASGTGKAPPSFLMGLTFIFLGRIIGETWKDRRQAIIVRRLNSRNEAAWEMFCQQRIYQYKQHIYDLSEFFFQYTGKKYVVISSTEKTLSDDLVLRRQLFSARNAIAKNPFDEIVPFIKRCIPGKKIPPGVVTPPPVIPTVHKAA